MPSFEALLPHLPAWLLVLFRIGGIFIFAPMFGSSAIPARIKIMLALALSMCIYPMLLGPDRPAAALIEPVIDTGLSMWVLGPAIFMELAIGFVIGYGATLPLMGLQLAGRMIDQQIGMGLAGVFNPELEAESGIVGEIYFMLALAIFILMDGHRVAVMILVGTFDNIPPGGFAFDGHLLAMVVALLGAMFELAMRVAAPLLCIIFLQTVAMGFIARTVPQLNILSIGFPVRILVGVLLLTASVAVEAEVFIETMRWMMGGMRSFFEGYSAGD